MAHKHLEEKRAYSREYMKHWRKTEAGQAWEQRVKERKRARAVADPEKYATLRRAEKFKARYGITLEDYERMFQRQAGLCLVCRRPPKEGQRLFVDHDHTSGVVRALLCRGCNSALGYMDEDADRILGLALYARVWSP